MGKIKKSYGIICCRKDPNKGLQVIMIKKPTTYHFCEFVAGHYRKSDDTHLLKLFNNMTYHEKIDILSLKFNIMWYRIYKSNPDQVFLQSSGSNYSKHYIKKKAKFESAFLQDGGTRLKKLMCDTLSAETLWEIPKGRKSDQHDEENINTAIREFSEETNIDQSKYQVLWRVQPYIETYSDFGTTYQNIYYYAHAIDNWEPTLKFSNGMQISEVSAIMWCSLNDIHNMRLDKHTHSRLVKLFKKITKKIKNTKILS